MKKIFFILSILLIFMSTSESREDNYSRYNISDLLKKGFKIIKQEQSGNTTLVFLTNNKDFVVCEIQNYNTFCLKQ
jgi:hypothetical protein